MNKNEKVGDPVAQIIADYERDLHGLTTIFRRILYIAGGTLTAVIAAIVIVLTT